MTRGKHARAAAVRREAYEQQAEIATYQRKVAELTRTLEKTKTEAAEAAQRHRATAARLQQQIVEGTSPALTVAQRENEKLRQERDHAKAEHRHIWRVWQKAWGGMHAHFVADHNMTGVEAYEVLSDVMLDDETFMLDTVHAAGLDKEAIYAIQRARGDRNRTTGKWSPRQDGKVGHKGKPR